MKGVIEEYGIYIVEFIAAVAMMAILYFTWDQLSAFANYIIEMIFG